MRFRHDHTRFFSTHARHVSSRPRAFGRGMQRQEFKLDDRSDGLPDHHRSDHDDVPLIRRLGVDLGDDAQHVRVDRDEQRCVPHGHAGRLRFGERQRPVRGRPEYRRGSNRDPHDHGDTHHDHSAGAVNHGTDAAPRVARRPAVTARRPRISVRGGSDAARRDASPAECRRVYEVSSSIFCECEPHFSSRLERWCGWRRHRTRRWPRPHRPAPPPRRPALNGSRSAADRRDR